MISHIRSVVIEQSVAVEQMINNQVCLLLGIDRKESTLFGSGSRSLPFNLKIELLKELSFFDTILKQKLTRFSEIRNKFAHLVEIKTFSDCFTTIDGLINNMGKWYPKIAAIKHSNDEEKFREYYSKLFQEIAEQVDRFVTYYNDKVKVNSELEVKKRHFDCMIKAMEEVGKDYEGNAIVEEFVRNVFLKTKEKYNLLEKGEILP